MDKSTGFLEYERRDNETVLPAKRLLSFEEFHRPLAEHRRREQAARCMDCGVPFCQSAMRLAGMVTGCPLHNLIPEWNDQICAGNMEHAYARLAKTSNFPEFTGRVCPALCEKACICGEHGEPVTVHDNELFLIETAFAEGFVKPRMPQIRSGRRVAVVGSGPAGLAAADELNHRGHEVTVYERDDRIGGLLMYGIPNMKLEKQVILRRQRLMEEEGVRFVTGYAVDTPEKAARLKADYDAVVLCCGARRPRGLQAAVIPAEETTTHMDAAAVKGVCYAVDYLTETTRQLLESGRTDAAQFSGRQRHAVSAHGKHVVVVGGGDTGNDCIATALRQGCRSVTALEMMPEPPAERTPDNPWPEWPKTLRTDYGHEEAAAVFGKDPRVFSTTVKSVIPDRRGNLAKVTTVRVERTKDGEMREISGSEQTIPCELLLIAAGFTGCEPQVPELFGAALSKRGVVQTAEDSFRSDAAGIFTAGDMHRGPSLVVWAIAEGRQCAHEVDRDLMGYSVQ